MKHLARILTAAFMKGIGLMDWAALVGCAVVLMSPWLLRVAWKAIQEQGEGLIEWGIKHESEESVWWFWPFLLAEVTGCFALMLSNIGRWSDARLGSKAEHERWLREDRRQWLLKWREHD